MENSIFIDTGAYLGHFNKRDTYHEPAAHIWYTLRAQMPSLITTNHVLDELATLLARRTSYEFSAMKIQEIYQSDTDITRPSEEEELKALTYFKKYADHKISFTDCLSFVVMKNLSIKQVFTFDQHFKYAGFDVIPQL